MDNSQEFRSIELCAGYAGISLGLKRVIKNFRTVAYVEIEAFANANLVAKMEAGQLDVAPVWSNLKTFNAEPFRDRIHIITGGFPCQPFSVAGARLGTEDERHLFPYIERTIDTIRPVAVFLENVEGIITTKTLDHRPELKEYCVKAAERLGNSWGAHMLSFLTEHCGVSVLQYVKHRLEKIGYKVEAGIFSAAECGAPQQRKRVFILAVCNSNGFSGVLRETGQGPDGAELRTDVDRESLGDGGDGATCGELANSSFSGSQGNGYPWKKWRGQPSAHDRNRGNVTFWPSRPGQPQYEWEPPRVVADSISLRKSQPEGSQRNERGRSVNGGEGLGNTKDNNGRPGIGKEKTGIRTDAIRRRGSSEPSQRKIKPAVGGNLDGCSDRMDYAELCYSCDNRTDELRLLGNGVVQDTAEKAFIVLFNKIMVGINATT